MPEHFKGDDQIEKIAGSITVEEAEKLVQNVSGELDVRHLSSIDVSVAEILAKCEDGFHLDGLTQLDVPVAEALVKCKGVIYLDGLTQLDVPVAEALSKCKRNLSLSGFTHLDVSMAEILAKCGGDLYLNGLTNLDVPVAETLVKRVECLSFGGLTQLSVPVAETLAKCKMYLSLDGLTQLSVPVAEALAKQRGYLYFNFTNLDVPVAEALAKHEGDDLNLDGLTQLDVPAAEALAKYKGILTLQSLTKADPPVGRLLLNRGNLEYHTGLIIREFVESLEFDEDEDSDEIENLDGLPSKMAHWQPLFDSHPNFKDMVVDESSDITSYLKENGVSYAERFHNLNAGRGAEGVINEVLQFIELQSNGFGVQAFLDSFERKTRKEFSRDSGFIAVYMDETLQILQTHLNYMIAESKERLNRNSDHDSNERRKAFLQDRIDDPNMSSKVKKRYRKNLQALLSRDVSLNTIEIEGDVKQAEALLANMSPFHLRKQGQVSYALGSRSKKDLTLGDKCSDCTSAKIHGMNFWTVPTWLTDPGFNFLLQYDKEGNLAHKFGLVFELGSKDGSSVPVLTIDSLELANSQKGKAGMYNSPACSQKEEELMKGAIEFIRNWASDMGFDPDNLYASTVSNTGVCELDEKYPRKKISISKLGALEASQRILDKANPGCDSKVEVYLQSLVVSEGQGPAEENEVDENALERGDREVDFARVEACFDQFLHSESQDVSSIRGLLELARTDVENAARKLRIFLLTEASSETKKALSVEGYSIDSFLNSRGHSMDSYLKVVLGQTEVARGKFVKANLFHLGSKVN